MSIGHNTLPIKIKSPSATSDYHNHPKDSFGVLVNAPLNIQERPARRMAYVLTANGPSQSQFCASFLSATTKMFALDEPNLGQHSPHPFKPHFRSIGVMRCCPARLGFPVSDIDSCRRPLPHATLRSFLTTAPQPMAFLRPSFVTRSQAPHF